MQLYIKGLYFNRSPLLWIKKDTEKPFNHSNIEHFSERTKEQNSLVTKHSNIISIKSDLQAKFGTLISLTRSLLVMAELSVMYVPL